MAIPSKADARYSALEWPKGCSASGGWAATRRAQKATSAARRFTIDSTASERRPTEPVSFHAVVFMPMVTIAAAMERSAKRWAAAGSGRGVVIIMARRGYAFEVREGR